MCAAGACRCSKPPAQSVSATAAFSWCRAGESLFDQTRRAAEAGEAPTELEKLKQVERDLMAQVSQVQVHSLISAKEYAEGIKYTAPLVTDWRAPRHLRDMTREQCDVRPRICDAWVLLFLSGDL